MYEEQQAALPEDVLQSAELPSLEEHVVRGIPLGGARAKEVLVLLRRAILVYAMKPTSEIIRLHMHIADDAILHLLFGGQDGAGTAITAAERPDGPLRPLLLAAHLFLYTAMRQVPKKGAVARTLVARLEEELGPGQHGPRRVERAAADAALGFICRCFSLGAAARGRPEAKRGKKTQQQQPQRGEATGCGGSWPPSVAP